MLERRPIRLTRERSAGGCAEALLGLLAAAVLLSCGPKAHLEMEAPFDLTVLLAARSGPPLDTDIDLQILDTGGRPVPFGLLRMEWIEGGRISLQSDERGRLTLRFEPDLLDYQVMISAETKAEGQDLMQADYKDSTFPLVGGRLRMSWSNRGVAKTGVKGAHVSDAPLQWNHEGPAFPAARVPQSRAQQSSALTQDDLSDQPDLSWLKHGFVASCRTTGAPDTCLPREPARSRSSLLRE